MEILIRTADAAEVDPAEIGHGMADLGYHVRLVDVNDGTRTWEPGDDYPPPVPPDSVSAQVVSPRHGVAYRWNVAVTDDGLDDLVQAVSSVLGSPESADTRHRGEPC